MRVVIYNFISGGSRSTKGSSCTPGSCVRGCVSERNYGREMGNLANINCPVCRGVDITKAWVVGNGYYECNACGARFKL